MVAGVLIVHPEVLGTLVSAPVAACEKFGGRATAELDHELCAHLVVPRSASVADNDVFYVTAPFGLGGSFEQSPNAPMSIRHSGSVDRDSEIVAVLEPGDDDGFAAALGEWTRLVPWSTRHVPVAPADELTGPDPRPPSCGAASVAVPSAYFR